MYGCKGNPNDLIRWIKQNLDTKDYEIEYYKKDDPKIIAWNQGLVPWSILKEYTYIPKEGKK